MKTKKKLYKLISIKGYFKILETIKQKTAIVFRTLESEKAKKNKGMKDIYLILLLFNIILINQASGQCIGDITPPVAICKTNLTVVLDSMGTVEVEGRDIDNNSSDSCGIETYLINGLTSINLSCSNIGIPVPVQLVVIDSSGNADTCNNFVFVVDNTPPKAICAGIGTITVPLSGVPVNFPVAIATAGSSDNCSIADIYINDEIAPTLDCEDIGIYAYVVKMKDPTGNIAWCQSQIEVTWDFSCGFVAQLDSLGRTQCNTGACTGYAALSANGAAAGLVTYLWDDGSTAIVRNDLCARKYMVIATDALNNVDTLEFRVRFEADCVWPGDTDNNTKANNYDLLPIALAYGTTGAARVGATNAWAGQSSNNWNIPLALGVLPNYKHIDCNGDAIIDFLDVNAIKDNYARNYWRSSGTTTTNSNSHSQDPPFYVDCDTVREGDQHCMGLNLGTPSTEAVDAYAIAFTINYDPLFVDSATITYGSSWLGTASDLISVEKDYSTHGKLETAVGRTDHQPMTGNGRIGTVCFTIRDDILRVTQPDTVTMPIEINQVRFVDEVGNEKGTDPQNGCLTIIEVLDAVKKIDHNSNINLYPNPTTGKVRISGLEDGLQKITVRTITGELLVTKIVQGRSNFELNLSKLPEAVYLVSIETSDKIINKKLLIIKG